MDAYQNKNANSKYLILSTNAVRTNAVSYYVSLFKIALVVSIK